MRLKNLFMSTIAAAFVFAGGAAQAVTVDFESFADEQNIAQVALAEGVTITKGGDAGGPPPYAAPTPVRVGDSGDCSCLTATGQGIRSDPFATNSPFRADFAVPVTAVSVQMGDDSTFSVGSQQDTDTLFLRAFDAGGVEIAAQVGVVYPDSAVAATGMVTLMVTAPAGQEIAYVTFGGTSNAPNGPNSLYADNLTFSPVPIPASLPLFIGALAALVAVARRRRSQAGEVTA